MTIDDWNNKSVYLAAGDPLLKRHYFQLNLTRQNHHD
jgi:hypothetical protein